MALCDDGFRFFEFPPAQRNEYKSSMRSVLLMMPSEAKKRIAKNLTEITFYRSLDELNLHKPASKQGYVRLGGYHKPSGRMYVDGGTDESPTEEIYAHELAHAIEGPHDEISSTDSWKVAWKKEIFQNARLSPYATESASEGFAEFAKLAYAKHSAAFLRAHYPACYAVWKAHGLIN